MASYNHSKFKNTYLIFEFLVRQLTTELMNEGSPKKSPAFNLIQKYYSKGLLKEELSMYNALLNNHITKEYTVNFLINECVDRYQKIDQKKLSKKRYNLIGEIKENYNINKLFSAKIEDYKEAGNIYFLFESIKNGDFVEKSKQVGMIMENIMRPPKENKSLKIFESIKNASPENRKLAYYILIERFNKKFASVLNDNQKKYIRDYIYNTTNNNGWISEHIKKINKELHSVKKYLNEGTKSDKILGLKINECINKVKYVSDKKIMNKDDHIKIFLSYKLVEQLQDLHQV